MAKNIALRQRNQLKNLVATMSVKENHILVFHESLRQQVFKMVEAGAFKGLPVVPVIFVADMAYAVLAPAQAAKEAHSNGTVKPEEPSQPAQKYRAFTMVKKPAPPGTYPGLYVLRTLEIEGDKLASVHDEVEDVSGVIVGRIMGEIERLTQ